jgi:hypothetical protein
LIHLRAVLAEQQWLEFKPLVLRVLARLREAGHSSGGDEMLRLRTYNALQDFVRHGVAERAGQQYRGTAAALLPEPGSESGAVATSKTKRRTARDESSPAGVEV